MGCVTQDNDPSTPVNLPATWSSYGMTASQYVSLMRHSLPVLARRGTRIDSAVMREIATAAKVPFLGKLLHDPQLLYEEGLRFALRQTWPLEADLGSDDLSNSVPAEALREVVRTTYRRFQHNPDSVALIVSENLFGSSEASRRVGVMEESPIVLRLDRILMRGHDVGAFRGGVSAEDLYILILSLCGFPVSVGSTFHMLYGMNVADSVNTRGMEELAADAVVAFLTTPMPTNQGSSYTHSSLSAGVGPSVAASLYSRESVSPAVSRGSVSSSDANSSDFPDENLYQDE